MNKELYKLLCCMLPYEVKFQKELVKGYIDTHEMRSYNIEDIANGKEKSKPILKSELSDNNLEEMGEIVDFATSGYIKSWLNEGDGFGYKESKLLMDYLYSIHYAFGIDKSLYIEK